MKYKIQVTKLYTYEINFDCNNEKQAIDWALEEVSRESKSDLEIDRFVSKIEVIKIGE